MFSGLSAFPLTPLAGGEVDVDWFATLVARLAEARVDSITVLGSTGCAAYLTREERARVARVGVERGGDTPVIVGISALRTEHVLRLADDAQRAGAAGVLLAPMSYQPLTADDVHGLYADVAAELSVPLVVYENPTTTRFEFTDELHASIARLPHVASVKIPAVPADPAAASERIRRLRGLLPEHTTIGVSGDAAGAAGLNAGCDAWYSVLGGTLPAPTLEITRAAQAGDAADALERSSRLQPLWALFAAHGSLRVTAAIAELLGLAQRPSLPRPIRGLDDEARGEVAAALDAIGVRD